MHSFWLIGLLIQSVFAGTRMPNKVQVSPLWSVSCETRLTSDQVDPWQAFVDHLDGRFAQNDLGYPIIESGLHTAQALREFLFRSSYKGPLYFTMDPSQLFSAPRESIVFQIHSNGSFSVRFPEPLLTERALRKSPRSPFANPPGTFWKSFFPLDFNPKQPGDRRSLLEALQGGRPIDPDRTRPAQRYAGELRTPYSSLILIEILVEDGQILTAYPSYLQPDVRPVNIFSMRRLIRFFQTLQNPIEVI